MLDNAIVLQLVERAKNGDQTAKTMLIEENSPLIKSLIKRFRNKGVEYDDLYQIGCIGFLKAINNFDEGFGVKFSTYAVPMVIGEIKRFMRDDGSIKVSRALKTLNLQINKFVNSFSQENQKAPTIAEIARNFAIDEQEVVLAMDSAKMPLSIYTPIEDDSEGLMLVDRIESPDDINSKMVENIALVELVRHLEERDKKIIMLRYYFDKTQSEIAKELNISQVQVSRIENRILSNLKKKLI